MFLHSWGVLLQVHRGGFVAVVVGGCHHLGCKVTIGSIAGHHGRYTWKGIFPCYAVRHHGGGL
jgi:Rieske Fe-S protein